MRLAKDCLDVGLYTDDWPGFRSFYGDTLGLPYEELLKVGGGVHQHRYSLRGSVLKVNASRDQLPASASGYRRLLVAAEDHEGSRALVDPGGLGVVLVAPGTRGVTRIGVEMRVTDTAATARFLTDGLGAQPTAPDTFRLGTTMFFLEADPDAGRSGPLRAAGFRYLTVQVYDVAAQHRRLLDSGAEEGMAPTRLGDTAAISFVRDPDGNWVEISQRASLTGALPDDL